MLKSQQRVKHIMQSEPVRYFLPISSARHIERALAPNRVVRQNDPEGKKFHECLLKEFPEIASWGAQSFLTEFLADGRARSGAEIRAAARKLSIDPSALESARRRLKVKITGQWRKTSWSLPSYRGPSRVTK